jgi:hypothetical protein
MQTAAAQYAASEAKRTKAKISGFPVAIPICVQATDSEEQVAMLQYYVIADIQFRKIRDILQKQN